MKKLLLTGFEPFGGDPVNPSSVIAQDFHRKVIGNIEIIGRTIPLRFYEIDNIICGYIEEFNPDIIINLGQALRPTISYEYVAINLAHISSESYNCGAKPNHETLTENGPKAYFTSLPVQKLVKHLSSHNIPSYISYSAGTFGCNQIFYSTMHYIHTNLNPNSVSAGFIHIPLLPEQTVKSTLSSSMSLDFMKKSIELIIDFFNLR